MTHQKGESRVPTTLHNTHPWPTLAQRHPHLHTHKHTQVRTHTFMPPAAAIRSANRRRAIIPAPSRLTHHTQAHKHTHTHVHATCSRSLTSPRASHTMRISTHSPWSPTELTSPPASTRACRTGAVPEAAAQRTGVYLPRFKGPGFDRAPTGIQRAEGTTGTLQPRHVPCLVAHVGTGAVGQQHLDHLWDQGPVWVRLPDCSKRAITCAVCECADVCAWVGADVGVWE